MKMLLNFDTIKIAKVSDYTFFKVLYKGCCHMNTQITAPTSGSFWMPIKDLADINSYYLICIFIITSIRHEKTLYLLDSYADHAIINKRIKTNTLTSSHG